MKSQSMLLVMALSGLAVLSSCSSAKTERAHNAQPVERPEAVREPVPAGQCRLLATVLAVHAVQTAGADRDPCSLFPCTATVRIDSVLGYGSGFATVLGTGQVIDVRFAYTLAPSKQAYPDAAFSLPGLSVGERFQADFAASEEMSVPGTERGAVRYGVGLYATVR
jgi:hypothetical protein